jgi:predicted RNA methylase
VTKLESPSPLVPSTTLMKFLARITSSYGAPILDAPCGFGRNALALAVRGYDVVGVDRDIWRLNQRKCSRRYCWSKIVLAIGD